MANFATYFIKNPNDIASKKDSMVIGEKYRITILTERLVRLEYSPNGVFEDHATSRVIFRNFERSIFSKEESETLIQIKTKYFTLNYVKNGKFDSGKLNPGSNLRIKLNDTDREWYIGHPEGRNLEFGGTGYSLDGDITNPKEEKGLYSTDGFSYIDDSNSLILNDNGEYVERENKEEDIYVFMYKRDFGLCLTDYYTLTGYPSMIPKYALGNWWYKNDKYTLEDIKSLIKKFDENNIPISNFMLGNNWHDATNSYTFDAALNVGELKKYLVSKNINLGVTLNPELPINPENSAYQEITRYFQTEGKPFNFLPLDAGKLGLYFNSFIRPLETLGVNIFNIDYENINDLNNLWLLNHYHYVENDLSKSQRNLILSRNPGMAPQRYPILYSGKTKVSWDTLSKLPTFNSSASNIGVSWWAHAIGGYYGGIEDDELYIRYIQFGVFSPIFILASDQGKYYKREPWRWNQQNLAIIKEYMQLREGLIPYIYTEGYNYYKTGLPIIQPMYYSYPKIVDELNYKNQYFFGSQMMIAPIVKKKNSVMNRVVQKVFVPSGVWYDMLTGKKFPGDKYYVSFYKDEDYPVFCKAGAIIPMQRSKTNMEFMIFPGASNSYNLYDDDGISNKYKIGSYSITELKYSYQKDNYNFTLTQRNGNSYNVNKMNYSIRFRNTNIPSGMTILVDNKPYQAKYIEDHSDFIVYLNDINIQSNISIIIQGTGLEVEAFTKIYEEIGNVIDDLEVNTLLKEKIDAVLFSDLPIKKKRIEIKKLKRFGLEEKFVKMFINLLEYMSEV